MYSVFNFKFFKINRLKIRVVEKMMNLMDVDKVWDGILFYGFLDIIYIIRGFRGILVYFIILNCFFIRDVKC